MKILLVPEEGKGHLAGFEPLAPYPPHPTVKAQAIGSDIPATAANEPDGGGGTTGRGQVGCSSFLAGRPADAYRLLARGQPVAVAALAEAVGQDEDSVGSLLGRWPDVFTTARVASSTSGGWTSAKLHTSSLLGRGVGSPFQKPELPPGVPQEEPIRDDSVLRWLPQAPPVGRCPERVVR